MAAATGPAAAPLLPPVEVVFSRMKRWVTQTLPGFDWQAWQGVVATAGTPPAVVARLNAEMQRFQYTEEFRAQLIKFGMEPWPPNTAEQFAEVIRNDMTRWAAVVKASGAKVD